MPQSEREGSRIQSLRAPNASSPRSTLSTTSAAAAAALDLNFFHFSKKMKKNQRHDKRGAPRPVLAMLIKKKSCLSVCPSAGWLTVTKKKIILSLSSYLFFSHALALVSESQSERRERQIDREVCEREHIERDLNL
jgi:hypothetical protein